MFDYKSHALLLVFLSFVWYIILILKYRRAIYDLDYIRNSRIISFIFVWFIIYSTFGYLDGDNFHYTKWIKEIKLTGQYSETSYAEIIYQKIIRFCNANNEIFRLIVWGNATLVICITSKILKFNSNHTLFIIGSIFLIQFSYARVTLGIAIYFLGLSLFIEPLKKFKIISYILAIIIIIWSIQFHRSMYILIAMTPLIFTPKLVIRSKGWLVSIFYLILIVGFVYFVNSSMFNLGDYIDNKSVLNKWNLYTAHEVIRGGIGGSLFYISFLLYSLIVCLYILRKYIKKVESVCLSEDILLKFSIGLVLIGSIFQILIPSLFIISKRIIWMAWLPMTYLLVKSYYNKILSKIAFSRIIIVGISISLYKMLYYIYLINQGSGFVK